MVAITLSDFAGMGFSDAALFAIVLAFAIALARLRSGRSTVAASQLDLRTEPRFRPEALVTGAHPAGIALVVSYATWAAYATRYAAVFFPFVMVLVAGGLLAFRARWVRFGAFALVVGMFSVGALYNVRDQRTQLRQIARAVAAEAKPGDLVVYCPDQLGPAGSREMPSDGPPGRLPDLRRPATSSTGPTTPPATRRATPRPSPSGSSHEAGTHPLGLPGVERVLPHARGQVLGPPRRPDVPPARARQLVPDGGGSFFEHAAVTWLPAPT